jgi:eukaryotic-like serine/threonine-protein kinase
MDVSFDTVRELFERCLDAGPAACEQLLAGQPEAVGRRVRAMLTADAQPLGLLDDFAAHATELLQAPAGGAAPQRIGEFEVERELGRGGMGTVYLARQQAPARWVAIKCLAGSATRESLDRFRREADLLARLQHPGIAAIHGVGQDDHGQPFIVMEYVDGRTLREFARRLPLEERLRLLATVCDAVDHAHQRGVIHRDLKPGNVLVTPDGQAKVLDFGIARLADPAADAQSLTATGVLLGTPAFMSPEQASGRIDLVGPASDVYALAVIGYELLTDRLPVPVSGLSPLQAMRAIADETPPPLSRIVPALRGDLELIFATALAKDPAARYPGAAAFGDDLRRYLARETIRARRPSLAYRALLFARRKPALVASLAAATLALLLGTAAATWFALGERSERLRAESALRQAEEERTRAENTLRFLTSLLAEADPANSGKPDLAVKDVLDRALPQVESLPEKAQAPLLLVLADALAGFGAPARVSPLYERTIETARRQGDHRTADTASARHGAFLFELGRVREARDLLALLLAREDLTLEPPLRRRALAYLGRSEAQLGRLEAVKRVRAQLAREPGATTGPGEVPPELLLASEEIRVLADLMEYPAMAPLFADLQRDATALLGDHHPFVLSLEHYQVELLFQDREDTQALALARSSLARHRKVLGDAHPATLRARMWLANAEQQMGRMVTALKLTEETLAQAEAELPADSVTHLEITAIGHGIQVFSGLPDAAIRTSEPVYERFCTDPAALHEWCGLLAARLAGTHAQLGHAEAKADWLRRSDDFLDRRIGPDHLYHASSRVWIADAEARRGEAEGALRSAREAEDILARQEGAPRVLVQQIRLLLAFTYTRIRRFDLAAPHAAIVHAEALRGGPGAPLLSAAARVHALSLAGNGRFAEAERVLLDAWERVQSLHPQDQGDTARTLWKLYREAGKTGQAEHWLGVVDRLLRNGVELAIRDGETWAAVEAYRKARGRSGSAAAR